MLHLHATIFDLEEPFLIASAIVVCIIFNQALAKLEALLCTAEGSQSLFLVTLLIVFLLISDYVAQHSCVQLAALWLLNGSKLALLSN